MASAARLPSFIIIGAAKSGTTTLFSDLGAHPDVFFPVVKEPGDLASDAVLTPRGLDSYKRLFSDARPRQTLGEASTIYTAMPMFTGAARRARLVLGTDVNLVYLVREPIDRLLSEHRYSAMIGKMSPNINRALETDAWLIEQSRYAFQLAPWLEELGAKRLRVLVFEDYVADRLATVTSLFEFLGVNPHAGFAIPEMRNKSTDVVVPPRLLKKITRSEFYRRTVRRWVPLSIRDRLKPYLGRVPKIQLEQTLTPANHQMLIDKLGPEVERFRRMTGTILPWKRFES